MLLLIYDIQDFFHSINKRIFIYPVILPKNLFSLKVKDKLSNNIYKNLIIHYSYCQGFLDSFLPVMPGL